MRKSVVRMLVLIFSFFTVGICVACHHVIEQNEPKTYIVEFFAVVGGGRIEGKTYQEVKEGESTEKVVAIAAVGYYFVGWSDYGDGFNDDETVTRDERIIENVHLSRSYLAIFAKIDLCVSYESGGNGSIAGTLEQHIKYGESGASVTAVPNKGYRFVGWSDGIQTPTRQDKNITDDLHV